MDGIDLQCLWVGFAHSEYKQTRMFPEILGRLSALDPISTLRQVHSQVL